MICPACHAEMPDGSLFCSACGARLEPTGPASCARCGAELAPESQFCSQCGAPTGVGPASAFAPDAEVVDDGVQEAVTAMWGAAPATPEPAASPAAAASSASEGMRICPSCGALIGPIDPYCPVCGVRLLGSRMGTGPAVATVPAAVASPDATVVDVAREALPTTPDPHLRSGSTGPMPRVAVEDETEPSSGSGTKVAKTVGITLGVVAALGLSGFGIWSVLQAQNAQQQAADQADQAAQALHPVTIAVSADGWDTEQGASRLPVRITGTTSTGEAFDEVQYVSTSGEGIALRQGTYRLSVAGSPIAADGTIYTVDDVTIDLTIDTDDPAASIDATAAGGFTLTAIPALEVTDDQILAAYDLARGDTGEGAPSAEVLRDAAIGRRDDAAEAQREQEEQQAYNARHVVADSYEFYMPSYWDGRVTVQTDGDHVSVRSSKYPDLEVFNVTVQDGPTQAMGDIGYACLGDVALGDGRYATVWAYRWAWIIASANLRGSTDPDDYYTMDEANEIVDLQMGGNVDYESVLEEMTIRDGESDLVFVADDYLYECIVESLTGK